MLTSTPRDPVRTGREILLDIFFKISVAQSSVRLSVKTDALKVEEDTKK